MPAPSDLPTAIDKRNMLYAPDPRKPFDPGAVGAAFEAKGRFSEALDFYERIADLVTREEKIRQIRKVAIEAGTSFLVNRIAAKGYVKITKEDWRATALAAKATGQIRNALRAAIQAGEEALVAELRATLGDAVPAALAAQAESPEQAQAGATVPGHKVEAVAAAGPAHVAEPAPPPPTESPKV